MFCLAIHGVSTYFLFFILAGSSWAAPDIPGLPVDLPTKPGDYTITPQPSVIATIRIIVGFFFCFLGQRFFKLVLFFAGFVTVGFVAYIVCYKIAPPTTSSKATIYLVVSIISGIIGGLLFACLWKLGLIAIGGLGGFALSMLILSLKDGLLISNSTARYIFIAVFVIIGMMLILFFEKPLLILGTAITGSYSLVVGIDYFARTGFTQQLVDFLNGSGQVFYHTTGAVYGMIATLVVLFIIGSVVQFKTYHGRNEK
ncbi:hypothetical protein K7432_010403 [Basidiobolus ranarum]|uniref:Transmembrane protein 198 n=1 Tax=Basidiobolus ranarum TaxID=34480 RepID=A0ABR2WNV0_9FUNG